MWINNVLLEELPIRLAHRVKELDELPRSLGDMPSIIKVKNWYAQSFQVNNLILLTGEEGRGERKRKRKRKREKAMFNHVMIFFRN